MMARDYVKERRGYYGSMATISIPTVVRRPDTRSTTPSQREGCTGEEGLGENGDGEGRGKGDAAASKKARTL